MANAGGSRVTSLLEELGRDLLMYKNDFTHEKFISQGGFAVVYSAKHTKHGRVALKVAQTTDETDADTSEIKEIAERNSRNLESIKREIQILRKFQHKNIIRLIGWCERDDSIAVVLELAKWVLFDDHRPEMSWTHKEWKDGSPIITNAVRVLYEIADGMQYLNSHSPPVLHMDLKSNNILVFEDGTAKIADFGISEESSYRDATTTKSLTPNPNRICMGTVGFASPEWLRDEKCDPSRRHDVYSYAIIMWEVLTYGRETLPYGTVDDAEIKKKILNGERPNCEKLYRSTPDTMKHLIQRCWHADFKQRPRFDEIKRIMELELVKLRNSGVDVTTDICAAAAGAAEPSREASQSKSYDVVDSLGKTVQSVAVEASNDTTGDPEAVDVIDARPVRSMSQVWLGSLADQETADAEAERGGGSRYAQEMGDVVASHASSNTPTGLLLYSGCLCVVGEAGAGKTRMVRSLQPQCEFRADAGLQSQGLITRVEFQLDKYKIIVNDFCGPEICIGLLPLLAPHDGLVALVYDMTKPWQTQAEEVKKWMSAVIAASPRMRLLVVGTHADSLDSQVVTKNMEDMRKLVGSILKEAKEQLRYHVGATGSNIGPESHSPEHGTADELEGPCCLWKTGVFSKSLKEMLDEFKSIEMPIILSFSCDSQSDGGGCSDALRSHILEKVKLRPPCRIESEWRPFVERWLERTLQDSSLVWTLERANGIFQALCNQENREALETILCHLVESSYIIWLRDHQRLKDCIFHSPDAFLGIVSKLFHGSLEGGAWIQKELAKFEKGILTDIALEHLLGEYQEDSTAVKLVLQHCNLVYTHGQGHNSTTILPFRLPNCEDSPGESNVASLSILLVSIRIVFETWIIPLEFFYRTMASLISTITGGRQAHPYCWKNGISYRLDAVKLRYKRSRNVLEIEARTELDKGVKLLWKHLDSLLCHVCGHILSDYPGVMPKVQFVCPNWAYDPKRVEEKCHGLEAELKEIVSGHEQGASTYHCRECPFDIPRAFVYNCKPESLSDDHVKDVALFLEKLKNKAGRPKNVEKVESEDVPPTTESDTQGLPDAKPGKPQKKTEATQRSELALKFQGARNKLIQNLDINAALHILDCLYSAFLVSEYEKDEVEAESLRADMIRRLVDITERRGDVATEAFLVALESDQVLRSDLASDIRNMRLH